jgi:hypothetical protein
LLLVRKGPVAPVLAMIVDVVVAGDGGREEEASGSIDLFIMLRVVGAATCHPSILSAV